jgi:hypothetical protein
MSVVREDPQSAFLLLTAQNALFVFICLLIVYASSFLRK